MTRKKLIKSGPGRWQNDYKRLERSLTNQTPSPRQVAHIEDVRRKAKQLAFTIDILAPNSRERSLAFTHLEETVMWAVKSIVLEES